MDPWALGWPDTDKREKKYPRSDDLILCDIRDKYISTIVSYLVSGSDAFSGSFFK